MVGGKPHKQLNERLFSFEFPEYPGALMHFLNNLGEDFNITLFHYRNHGAAEGMVLSGFDIPESQKALFEEHVSNLGFNVKEHIDNPAYEFFLASD
jgi:threonine dehydratase